MIDDHLQQIIKAYKSGTSASKLARKYSVSVWTILNRLRKNGIRIRSFKEQNERRLNLDQEQETRFLEIVDGLLLSDANIHQKKYYLQISQNGSNKYWLNQISALFLEIGCECKFTDIPARIRKMEGKEIKGKPGRLLRTPSYVEMRKQRKRWYDDSKKIIPEDVKITPLSVALWLCGDGTNNNGRFTFYTNGFSYKEVCFLSQRLYEELDVKSRVNKNQRQEWILNICRLNESFKLKNHIEKYIPDCFQYKLNNIRKAHFNQKLTDEQVLKIREMHKKEIPTKNIAEKFEVSIKNINNIINRKIYKKL